MSKIHLWIALFIERLYQRTSAEGIPLRVVLSRDSALYATLPEGPQYSIMCCNFYGPRANRNFLAKVFSVNRALPGRLAIALATDGFDWSDDCSVATLAQSAAFALQDTYAVPSDIVLCSEESQALSFHYLDEQGLSHEVSYSDGTTLSYWRSLASNAGYVNFDLFRLGGNPLFDPAAFFANNRVFKQPNSG